MLVAGTAKLSGSITIDSLDWSTAGAPDQPTAGDSSINVLDTGGNVLSQTTFALDFNVNVEPLGSIEMDTVPFAFSVPFPVGAAQVEVVHNGAVLVRQDLRSGMLATAIASIPDLGFVDNPTQRRNALLDKVAAFEQQLANGDTTGAAQKLTLDIRKHIVDWLVDGYATVSPLEYSKNEVLSVVDRVLQGL